MGAFDELDWAAYTAASLREGGLGGDINVNLLGTGFDRASWTNPLQNNALSQLDVRGIAPSCVVKLLNKATTDFIQSISRCKTSQYIVVRV